MKNKGLLVELIEKPFLFVLLVISFIWFRSGFDKLIGGAFSDALSLTLTKFAANNPYPFYKSLLYSTFIPNSKLIGNLVIWGELLVSIAILVPVIYLLLIKNENRLIRTLLLLGLLGGAFLNLNYWLASGWTSPSTDGLNLLMLAIESVGIISLLRKSL